MKFQLLYICLSKCQVLNNVMITAIATDIKYNVVNLTTNTYMKSTSTSTSANYMVTFLCTLLMACSLVKSLLYGIAVTAGPL